MKMNPEKSSADGGEKAVRPVLSFADDLKELYEAAGGSRHFPYSSLVGLDPQTHKLATSSLSSWLTGKAVPWKQENVRYLLGVLIPFLEKQAQRRSPGRRRLTPAAWQARHDAAKAVSKSGQGGQGPRVNAASRGLLLRGPTPSLQDVFPHDFVGRDEELAELEAFATAPDGAPPYLWWQAGPWAGKTALLAWFASRRLPAGVDVAHYFIVGRLGTDRREDFVRAVGQQLASATGSRRPPAIDNERPDLAPLYEAAARACYKRHRRLLLIVDGLDEDADAGLEGQGIAGLLPKHPPHGMRVIVTGRPNPRVPVRLVSDHPLRNPGIVRRLTDSPAALVKRDMALQELSTLLGDPGVGQRLLGLLVSAEGALTGADLGELVGITPYAVQQKLRSVVGRSMAPTRVDLLPLDAQAEADAEAGRQTFILAHEELHAAATDALGKAELAANRASLHAWADGYRDQDWPEDTPNYLLTGYTRLVHNSGNTDRLADLVLDPLRQLRLVQRSGPDVALADLDLIAPPGRANRTPSPSLSTAARASASRELLLAHVRPLPAAVARTFARWGDAPRARALACGPVHTAGKAQNLAGVARILGDIGHKQAAESAREAGEWARRALGESGHLAYVAAEAEAAAGQAALALLATGQEQEGLELLHYTRESGTARNGAWAEAARLLAPHRPDLAATLLNKLEEQAEDLAAELPSEESGEGSTSAAAFQLWETVATADAQRADRLHDRVLEHAHTTWDAAPTLQNVAVLASTASFLAQPRPQEAEGLLGVACQYVASVVLDGRDDLSAADAFHTEFGFRHTLAQLSQALTAVGAPNDGLLADAERLVPAAPEHRSGQRHEEDRHPEEADDTSEAERLADEAFRLANQGNDGEAERCLEQALALMPTAGPATGRAPAWLPDLAGALVRTDTTAELEALLDLAQNPADRTRAHAAVALAYADAGLLTTARQHAQEATRAAATGPTSEGTWAFAAQALAVAGEAQAAMDLIERQRPPSDRSRRNEWRKTDRTARIAVAQALAEAHPQQSASLLLPLVEQLHTSRRAPRSQGLLSRLAELLPAVTPIAGPQQGLLDEVREEAFVQMARGGPQTWKPEDVLVHAFLRIGDDEDPDRQMDWLEKDMANRGPGNFPAAGLAVLYAARGDTGAAQRVATASKHPRHCASALTAISRHLARIPSRALPGPDPARSDPVTRTVQHLALNATPHAPADNQAATSFLRQALMTASWSHAIPVLAQVDPAAIARVGDIVVPHARSRTDA
ncbi:hypothetical protein [Streptomyces antarcticus]|uniref:hypothetical protein n=1 Tax=Streptomyces antarcticus TaxID=2996458 RepID=UPI00226DF294|nr:MULTISPECIES: hypothetical protein [unclassified Streptomyces]MCY0947659.1 hypothetical protein [Streptomyces sp. H34-AA3]MCZ4087470.1 hypothetical protein [Streptomyces sp. H34-S5]